MPACAKCGSNNTVRNNGFRNNHFGRRIVALDHDYYCVSRRYRCNNCEQKAREAKLAIQQSAAANNIAIQFTDETDNNGQQYSFMAWHKKTLELYPHGIGQQFPAFVTHRSGVDRLLLDMMRPLFSSSCRKMKKRESKRAGWFLSVRTAKFHKADGISDVHPYSCNDNSLSKGYSH